MKTYIALFRGINVGGNNLLLMKDLVAALESAGVSGRRDLHPERQRGFPEQGDGHLVALG